MKYSLILIAFILIFKVNSLPLNKRQDICDICKKSPNNEACNKGAVC